MPLPAKLRTPPPAPPPPHTQKKAPQKLPATTYLPGSQLPSSDQIYNL